MKRRTRLTAIIASLAILAGAIFPGISQVKAATSASFNASITINPGTFDLTYSGSSLSKSVTLNGSAQTIDLGALGNVGVNDFTGTGDGWRVQVQANQVTENTPAGGFKTGTSAIKLPAGSLKIAPPSNITAGPGSSSAANITKLASTTAIDNGSAVTLATAPAGQGLGSFTISFPDTNALTVTIPTAMKLVDKDNYATGGTPYSTTVTFSLVVGP